MTTFEQIPSLFFIFILHCPYVCIRRQNNVVLTFKHSSYQRTDNVINQPHTTSEQRCNVFDVVSTYIKRCSDVMYRPRKVVLVKTKVHLSQVQVLPFGFAVP